MLHTVGAVAVVTAGIIGFWAGYRLDARRTTTRPAPHPAPAPAAA